LGLDRVEARKKISPDIKIDLLRPFINSKEITSFFVATLFSKGKFFHFLSKENLYKEK